VLAFAIASFSGLYAQKSTDKIRVVSPESLAAIEAAMPPKLFGPAKQARKVLVLSQSMGYYHASTPYGKAFFKQVQDQYDGYTFVLSDDQEDYRYENLKDFDAIVFNNGTRVENTITDPQIQSDVIRFIREGGGMVGIHGAADGGWPEFNEMIGFRFGGHPWAWNEEHSFIVEEPSHSCVQHIDEQIFRFTDEIYVSREQFFSRDEARVLISIDLADPITGSKAVGKGVRRDKDYPASYVKAFGSGRVFYTTFGHNFDTYKNPTVLGHYLAGLQYACGDMDAADEPISFYKRLSQFSGSLYYEAKIKLIKLARDAKSPEQQVEVLSLIRQLMADAHSTDASKDAAVSALTLIPTPEAIELATTLLGDPMRSHTALTFIVSNLNREGFTSINQQVWPSLSEASKLNMINAMGQHGGPFVDPLFALSQKGPESHRIAALKALGMCASADQMSPLAKLAGSPEFVSVRNVVLLKIAGQSPDASALLIYKWLLEGGEATGIRQAAIIGSVKADPSNGRLLVNRYLSGDDDALALAAIEASAFITGDQMTTGLARQASLVSEDRARALVYAIAERGTALVPITLERMLSVPELRLDAIDALSSAGTATQVPALVRLLGSADPVEAEVARDTLIELRSVKVDEAIASQLGTLVAPETLQRLLKVSNVRQTPVLAPAAMKLLRSNDSKVAAQALKTVALCGTTVQEFDQLCVVALENPRARSALKKLGSRLNEDEALATRLIAHAKKANADQREIFIQLLGDFQSTDGGRYLASLIGTSNADLEVEVVKVFSAWNSVEPVQTLLKVSKSAQSEKAQSLAFFGVARLISGDKLSSSVEKIVKLQSLLATAKTDAEITTVLEGLGAVPHPDVIRIVSPYLDAGTIAVSDAAIAAISSSKEKMSQVDWTMTSNFNSAWLSHLIDLNPSTRWTSNTPMNANGPMWIVVDMQIEQKVHSVLLDATGSDNDYPRSYELYVSNNADDFGEAISTGKGSTRTEIAADAFGRYVKIVQSGREGDWWSIHELKINGLPAK